MTRARVFLDFWNFQLSLNDNAGVEYRLDWPKFPCWLVEEASKLVDAKLDYDGATVYMSYNANSPRDKKLLGWANNVLSRFPGINVCISERKSKGPLKCQVCHQEILVCPHCSERIAKTIEKGVDTAIVTDLLGLAWEKAWDVAVLVTSDRDYIPAVKMLAAKGYRVINAYFPPLGVDLAKTCWANIDINSGLAILQRKDEKSPA